MAGIGLGSRERLVMEIQVGILTKHHVYLNTTAQCEKWGIWVAPCQEILVFGGKFWNLEGNCAFLYTKTYKLMFKFGGWLAEELTFFQAVI